MEERPTRSLADVGILTIKDEEFEALLDAFPDNPDLYVGPSSHRHYNLRTADAGNGKSYKIAIVRHIAQGTAEAQDAARDLLAEIHPRLVLVVGIAGGVPGKDIMLGDVVLSLHIHDYSLEARKHESPPEYSISGGPIGKVIEGHVANLKAYIRNNSTWAQDLPQRPSLTLESLVYYGPESWMERTKRAVEYHIKSDKRDMPKFISGVIGSSDRLIKDSSIIIQWLETSRNLLAVEMEAAGVYRATRERCAMLAIRGISDIVGLERDERWTRYACATAAAFTRAFLSTSPVPPSSQQEARREEPEAPRASIPSAHRETQDSEGVDFLPLEPISIRYDIATIPTVSWQLRVNSSSHIDSTKTELYNNLIGSMIEHDLQNYGRTARQPRVLLANQPIGSHLQGGCQLWKFSYQQASNEELHERVILKSNGSVAFQRDTFWQVEHMCVDFGLLAFDVAVFLLFASRFMRNIGHHGKLAFTLGLKMSNTPAGIGALFDMGPVRPEQSWRTAQLKQSPVMGTIQFVNNKLEKENFIALCKRLLDKVANEFILPPSHFAGISPSFLVINQESLKSTFDLLK